MKKVGKIAWEELNVKIEDQAKKYSPGNPETYVDTNLAVKDCVTAIDLT